MWDFSGSSPTARVREMVRERKESKRRKGNRVWELGREASRDSVWADVYSGMTARYTVDREGENEGGRVNEYYMQQ